MLLRVTVLLVLLISLVSCICVPVKQGVVFQLEGRDDLYDKVDWVFSGRFALSGQNESVSASIKWAHTNQQDEIELSGLFGQGRTIIYMLDGSITIDDGDKKVQYFGEVDALLTKHLGVELPVSALKYWVLGLVSPGVSYIPLENGFLQSKWRVKYQSMQQVGRYELPKKMKVESDSAQLKLIVNQWDI